jgi:hypothetical protein
MARPTSLAIPPEAVRVWRGYRASNMPLDHFFTRLGAVFIPATVAMQIQAGLDAYIPTVPGGLADKPDTVPDETAILFWDSQQTYADGFHTLAVRTYTLTHAAVYRPPSRADFPVRFTGTLTAEQPVYLIDEPADWMHGRVTHAVGGRPPVVAPADFIAGVAEALAAIQSSGIEGGVACAGDDYLVCWVLGDGASVAAAAKLCAWKTVVSPEGTGFDHGLWDVWPGMSVSPGASYNLQFKRRWEP